jgi:hypothetical protein
MKVLATLALAALHLAAASLPCPPAVEDEQARAVHASGAVHAIHSHAASPAEASEAGTRELRAPCPCGCSHGSGGMPAARLGPALLRIAPALAPGAGSSALAVAEPLLAGVAPGALDPVPRAA